MNNSVMQQQLPLYNMGGLGLCDAAESGLTFNSLLSAAEPVTMRKRQRGSVRSQEVASSCFQQHQMEIDRVVSNHMEKLRQEVWQKRTTLLQRLALAVQCRLKAKDEEIDRLQQLNAALQDRVRSLSSENQAWRDVAMSNEAMARTLRNDLEAALLRQQQRHGSDDAESCCDNGSGDGEERTTTAAMMCKGCGKGAASVLVLPCRHLCFCSVCASKAQECALCGCSKQCTIHVNFP